MQILLTPICFDCTVSCLCCVCVVLCSNMRYNAEKWSWLAHS